MSGSVQFRSTYGSNTVTVIPAQPPSSPSPSPTKKNYSFASEPRTLSSGGLNSTSNRQKYRSPE